MYGIGAARTLVSLAIPFALPDPMWEIGYNAYAGALGVALPQTLEQAMRPTGATHHMAWETLTHAGLGATGL